jgi:coatomer protein complex subunit epsilon
MSGSDSLYSFRNNFYLGAYQALVDDHEIEGLTESEVLERDTIVHRSNLALGNYQVVLDAISPSAPTAFQALRLLALYLSDPTKKEQAVEGIQDLLSDPATANNTTLILAAASILSHEGNYADALKFTHASTNLEVQALNVQMYLKMDRPDAAEKQLKAMQAVDEDHTLTQLANAWVDLGLGGSKIQDAYYIYQELSEKFLQTSYLLNGSAVCNIHKGNFEEAESLLQEALQKDPKDADTLANLVVVELHLGKPATKYLTQLKAAAPSHVMVQRLQSHEESYDRAVQAYA